MAKDRYDRANPNSDDLVREQSFLAWRLGEVSEYESGKMPQDGIRNPRNVRLLPDGSITKRPPFVNYGDGTLPGQLRGQLFKFSRHTNALMGVFRKSNRNSVWWKKDEKSAWAEITTASIGNIQASTNAEALYHFSLYENTFIITNNIKNPNTDTTVKLTVGNDFITKRNNIDFLELDDSNPNSFVWKLNHIIHVSNPGWVAGAGSSIYPPSVGASIQVSTSSSNRSTVEYAFTIRAINNLDTLYNLESVSTEILSVETAVPRTLWQTARWGSGIFSFAYEDKPKSNSNDNFSNDVDIVGAAFHAGLNKTLFLDDETKAILSTDSDDATAIASASISSQVADPRAIIYRQTAARVGVIGYDSSSRTYKLYQYTLASSGNSVTFISSTTLGGLTGVCRGATWDSKRDQLLLLMTSTVFAFQWGTFNTPTKTYPNVTRGFIGQNGRRDGLTYDSKRDVIYVGGSWIAPADDSTLKYALIEIDPNGKDPTVLRRINIDGERGLTYIPPSTSDALARDTLVAQQTHNGVHQVVYVALHTNAVKLFLPSIDTTKYQINVYVGSPGGRLYQIPDPTFEVSTVTEVAGALEFVDDGREVDITKPRPIEDSDASLLPDVRFSTVQNGRIQLYADKEHSGRIHYGGQEDNRYKFNSSLSSGYIELSVSDDDEIVHITSLYNQDSKSGLLVHTSGGINGLGKVYFLEPTNLAVGNEVQFIYSHNQIGTTGTDSPYAVVNHQGSVYNPSKTGFKVYGTRPSLQNIVATEDISQTIRTKALNLKHKNMRLSTGTAYRNRLYFTVDVTDDSKPDEIWILDLTLGQGSWLTNWTILNPTDNTKIKNIDFILTHYNADAQEELLVVSGNQILKLDESRKGRELMEWGFESGRLMQPESRVNLFSCIRVIFVIRKLVGRVKLTVWGRTSDAPTGLGKIMGVKIVGAENILATTGELNTQSIGGQEPLDGKDDVEGDLEEVSLGYVNVTISSQPIQWWGFSVSNYPTLSAVNNEKDAAQKVDERKQLENSSCVISEVVMIYNTEPGYFTDFDNALGRDLPLPENDTYNPEANDNVGD